MYHFKQEHQAPLAEVLVLKGELIFPDERDVKARWETERVELNRQKEALAQIKARWETEMADLKRQTTGSVTAAAGSPTKQDEQAKPTANFIPTSSWRLEPPRHAPQRPVVTQSEELICATCGKTTRDWWTNSPAECNACKFKKRGMEPQICSVCQCAYPPNYPMVEGRCQSCR